MKMSFLKLSTLVFDYLVRGAGITIGVFTLKAVYILYAFGLGTAPIWVQLIAVSMAIYSVLLMIPLRVLHRNKVIRYTYAGFSIFYIIMIFVLLLISFSESREVPVLLIQVSLIITLTVLLHIRLISKLANHRVNSIADSARSE